MRQAQESELDLVMVSETAKPPVCKIVNYGQYRYQEQKKERLSRKNSKAQVVKELKLSPKISDNDFNVRVNKCKEFLTKGYNVKIFVPFRGREIMHPELGRRVIERFIETVKDIGGMDQGQGIMTAHKSMMTMILPKH
jgi:translation initiation factor IF-3